jgi:histidine triad (HIT) family protein
MDCIFCKIAKKEISSKIVYEDKTCVAFRDVNPQAPTHILIVPFQHIEKLADLRPEDELLMGHLHEVTRKVAEQEKLKDYRIVINNGAGAGQSVWHLHLHLLGGRFFSWPPG